MTFPTNTVQLLVSLQINSYTFNMKKERILASCLAVYECIRLLVIITVRPEASVFQLPATWYTGAPLLAFPVLLACGFASTNHTDLYRGLYCIAKIMTSCGILFYARAALPAAIEYGAKNGYYTLRRIILLLIFFLIDCILIISVYFIERYRNTLTVVPAEEREG